MGAGILRRRVYDQEYMEVREDNLAEVAEWCGGELEEDGGCVRVPTFHGQEPAFPGMFVLKGKVDFYPVGDRVKEEGYEEIKAAS